MDYIINWSKYETVFNGDTVTMELLPLTNEGAAVLMDYFRHMKGKDELATMTEGDKIEMQRVLMHNVKALNPILAAHIRSIAGFTVNGEAPAVDALCDYPTFFPLVVEIVGELGRRSRLTKEDEKN